MDQTTPANDAAGPDVKLRQAGDRMRERIYVTFTAIAVLMAMSGHGSRLDPGTVLATLLITVIGVLLAGFTADIVSHMLVHRALPPWREFGHMLAVSIRALGAVVIPAVLLVLAIAQMLEVSIAVRVSIVALLVALGIVVWIAVRRARLVWWKSVVVLAVVVGLGVLVVLLEVLAHEA